MEKKASGIWQGLQRSLNQRPEGKKKPGSYLLSHGQAAVPSARGRFTSVFGMGTGVAALLWPPGVRMEAWTPCILLTLPGRKR